jgi:hypothetical protein
MGPAGKVDWQAVRTRYESWWQGELAGGPLIQVTAPAGEVAPGDAPPGDPDLLLGWFTDPAAVIPRLQREVARTYYGGDAFPVIFPFSTGLPAIEAAYLGCPYHIVGSTGWAEPLILDWDLRHPLQPDPQNSWWQITCALLEAGAASSQGRYFTGIPDLEGGGEIIAMLRGTQALAYDLFDHPQAVKQALAEEIKAWQYYYLACFEIINRCTPNLPGVMPGYVDWLGIWSERPFATVENDFSTMISPPMFREFFLPSLEQQIQFLDRSIFHLDGPEALPHLDTLLSLPRLDGIQWVLGPGDGLMTDWIPLLQKIQGAGKKVVAACQPAEVIQLVKELKPALLLLTTSCSSIDQAEILLAEVDSRRDRSG